jgi:hypothetical protein
MFTIIIREHALAAHAARRRDRPCGRIGTEAKVIALWCSAAAAAALHTDEVESRQVPQRRRADRVREAQVAGHVAVTSRVAESGRGSRQSRRRCGATGSGVTLRLRGTVPTWHLSDGRGSLHTGRRYRERMPARAAIALWRLCYSAAAPSAAAAAAAGAERAELAYFGAVHSRAPARCSTSGALSSEL